MIAGAPWGLLAYLPGARVSGPLIWPGALASPAIGPAVGRLTQARFDQSQGLWRGVIPLVGVYLGSVLFGLAIGIFNLSATGLAQSNPVADVVGSVLSVLWGVTLTGYLLVLWPWRTLHALCRNGWRQHEAGALRTHS
jgi:hypothetical protein